MKLGYMGILILVGTVVFLQACNNDIEAIPFEEWNNTQNNISENNIPDYETANATNFSGNSEKTKLLEEMQRNLSKLRGSANASNLNRLNNSMTRFTNQTICGKTKCGENQICEESECKCAIGFHSCEGKCIPNDQCCGNIDCDVSNGFTCVNKKCTFSCENVKCPGNMKCEEEYQGCNCPANYKFCKGQDKCIPFKNCCSALECGRPRETRCAGTVISAYMCIEETKTNGKACKAFGEGRETKVLDVNSKEYPVTITEFNYSNNLQIKVGEETIILRSGERKTLNDEAILVLESLKELGGECSVTDIIEVTQGSLNATNSS